MFHQLQYHYINHIIMSKHLLHILLGLSMVLMVLQSCHDNELDKLKQRVEGVEKRVQSLDELCQILDAALTGCKVIQQVSPAPDDQSGWIFTFIDGTSIDLTVPVQTGGIHPLLRIDQGGYWLWSKDNGQSFTPILSSEEERFTTIGPDAVNLRLIDDGSGHYVLKAYTFGDTTQVHCTLATPYDIDPDALIRSITFDDRRHLLTLTLRDGSQYTLGSAFSHPTSIAILSVRPISLTCGMQAAVEFRVNPSNAALDLESGSQTIELDLVGHGSRSSYVNPSDNVEIVSIEQVNDPVTQQPRQGQYRALLQDRQHALDYDESLALVLTCQRGTDQEYQISSSAFEVQSFDMKQVATGLPVVVINTPGAREINSRTDWMEGASMSILSTEGDIQYQGSLSVKGRGNTSWGFPKKPYALKLDKKSEILGMPAHKRWCLLANWGDRTLVRNAVAFELARHTGLAWTPSGQFVELVLNGQHMGNYYLCEQIKVDENRVNINKPAEGESSTDRGYIFELDTYFDEANKFYSYWYHLPWQFKDPDEVTPEQQKFVEKYVEEMETTLRYPASVPTYHSNNFVDYLDLASFADWWMVHEIAQNWEPQHPKSVYMHRDVGGRMTAGPVWDFDLVSFGSTQNFFFGLTESIYYKELFGYRGFGQLVQERWLAQRDGFLAVSAWLDSLSQQLSVSAEINYKMWPINIETSDAHLSYSEAIARLKQSMEGKIRWMDENIQSLIPKETVYHYMFFEPGGSVLDNEFYMMDHNIGAVGPLDVGERFESADDSLVAERCGDGWRLPTKKEFWSLRESGKTPAFLTLQLPITYREDNNGEWFYHYKVREHWAEDNHVLSWISGEGIRVSPWNNFEFLDNPTKEQAIPIRPFRSTPPTSDVEIVEFCW